MHVPAPSRRRPGVVRAAHSAQSRILMCTGFYNFLHARTRHQLDDLLAAEEVRLSGEREVKHISDVILWP